MSKVHQIDYNAADFLEGVSILNVAEIGMYWVVCSLIYARNEPVADDAKWIGRAAGCTPAYARKLVDSLIAKRKLSQDDRGRLLNGRVFKELRRAAKRVDDARSAGARGVDAKRTRAGRTIVSSLTKDLAQPAGPEPATSNQQPATSSSERVDARLRATPPGSGASRVSRATLIPDDWQPSDATVAELRKARPDLVGQHYDLELLKFRKWAAANAVLTHRVEASFIGFMIKARLPPRQTEEDRVAERDRILAKHRPKKEPP